MTFNKDYAYPTYIKVIVTGVNTSTSWNITDIDCPVDTTPVGYDTDHFYIQDWAWQDDVDPLGGGVSSVVVIEVVGVGWFYEILPSSGIAGFESSFPVGSDISLSTDLTGVFSSLSLLKDDFIQTQQSAGIVGYSNYLDINPDNYTIID